MQVRSIPSEPMQSSSLGHIIVLHGKNVHWRILRTMFGPPLGRDWRRRSWTLDGTLPWMFDFSFLCTVSVMELMSALCCKQRDCVVRSTVANVLPSRQHGLLLRGPQAPTCLPDFF